MTGGGTWLSQPTAVLRARDASGSTVSMLLSLANPQLGTANDRRSAHELTFEARQLLLPASGCLVLPTSSLFAGSRMHLCLMRPHMLFQNILADMQECIGPSCSEAATDSVYCAGRPRSCRRRAPSCRCGAAQRSAWRQTRTPARQAPCWPRRLRAARSRRSGSSSTRARRRWAPAGTRVTPKPLSAGGALTQVGHSINQSSQALGSSGYQG